MRVRTVRSAFGLVATGSRIIVGLAKPGIYFLNPGWTPPVGGYIFVEAGVEPPKTYDEINAALRANI